MRIVTVGTARPVDERFPGSVTFLQLPRSFMQRKGKHVGHLRTVSSRRFRSSADCPRLATSCPTSTTLPSRRRVLVGLNKQERMHSIARAVCFGRQGRFPDRDLEAQLSRASALSLVLNPIVVCNTRYLAAAEARLDAEEHAVPEETWRHLSPLIREHVLLVGTYCFDEPRPRHELRRTNAHEP